MLQQQTPENFVIATGESHSLEEFVSQAFREVGLDWKNHVQLAKAFQRPSDIQISCADPSRAAEQLGWTAKKKMQDVIKEMHRFDYYVMDTK